MQRMAARYRIIVDRLKEQLVRIVHNLAVYRPPWIAVFRALRQSLLCVEEVSPQRGCVGVCSHMARAGMCYGCLAATGRVEPGE